eukprot:jgi/Chrzof1/4271/Cz14g05210.t1
MSHQNGLKSPQPSLVGAASCDGSMSRPTAEQQTAANNHEMFDQLGLDHHPTNPLQGLHSDGINHHQCNMMQQQGQQRLEPMPNIGNPVGPLVLHQPPPQRPHVPHQPQHPRPDQQIIHGSLSDSNAADSARRVFAMYMAAWELNSIGLLLRLASHATKSEDGHWSIDTARLGRNEQNALAYMRRQQQQFLDRNIVKNLTVQQLHTAVQKLQHNHNAAYQAALAISSACSAGRVHHTQHMKRTSSTNNALETMLGAVTGSIPNGSFTAPAASTPANTSSMALPTTSAQSVPSNAVAVSNSRAMPAHGWAGNKSKRPLHCFQPSQSYSSQAVNFGSSLGMPMSQPPGTNKASTGLPPQTPVAATSQPSQLLETTPITELLNACFPQDPSCPSQLPQVLAALDSLRKFKATADQQQQLHEQQMVDNSDKVPTPTEDMFPGVMITKRSLSHGTNHVMQYLPQRFSDNNIPTSGPPPVGPGTANSLQRALTGVSDMYAVRKVYHHLQRRSSGAIPDVVPPAAEAASAPAEAKASLLPARQQQTSSTNATERLQQLPNQPDQPAAAAAAAAQPGPELGLPVLAAVHTHTATDITQQPCNGLLEESTSDISYTNQMEGLLIGAVPHQQPQTQPTAWHIKLQSVPQDAEQLRAVALQDIQDMMVGITSVADTKLRDLVTSIQPNKIAEAYNKIEDVEAGAHEYLCKLYAAVQGPEQDQLCDVFLRYMIARHLMARKLQRKKSRHAAEETRQQNHGVQGANVTCSDDASIPSFVPDNGQQTGQHENDAVTDLNYLPATNQQPATADQQAAAGTGMPAAAYDIIMTDSMFARSPPPSVHLIGTDHSMLEGADGFVSLSIQPQPSLQTTKSNDKQPADAALAQALQNQLVVPDAGQDAKCDAKALQAAEPLRQPQQHAEHYVPAVDETTCNGHSMAVETQKAPIMQNSLLAQPLGNFVDMELQQGIRKSRRSKRARGKAWDDAFEWGLAAGEVDDGQANNAVLADSSQQARSHAAAASPSSRGSPRSGSSQRIRSPVKKQSGTARGAKATAKSKLSVASAAEGGSGEVSNAMCSQQQAVDAGAATGPIVDLHCNKQGDYNAALTADHDQQIPQGVGDSSTAAPVSSSVYHETVQGVQDSDLGAVQASIRHSRMSLRGRASSTM